MKSMAFSAGSCRRVVAMAVPTSASRSFSKLVRPVNSAVLQQLEMFPEFKECEDACHKHQYARAVPPLTRMLQVCDSISPALAIEAAWELGKVHARLGHVDEAVRHFKRDSVHGTEQSIRVLLAHGAGAAALALASSLPSPSKEIYTAVAQYVSDGSVTLPATAADTIIGSSGVADAVYKANYAALAAASDLVIKADTAGLPESSQTKNLDQAVTLWNELVDAFSTQDEDANTTTPADLSFQATVLANLGEVYLAQGRNEDAMNILGLALKRNEAVPSEPLELARTLGLLAVSAACHVIRS
ncbi:hypothetical protein, variant [Aphanomyces astaci]|uniref:Uncharacterized protein n=1 Tax=Aphanomyces astaci TaxID=112090 RepID=W4G9U3_APHAT|nr:hypothetical protein, variant [Aphanomyces astaci]ETV76440.1 hypothetical protein, variant [Aphanomyces astaci]|eukprot:XP_009833985.1 hypothetical protein, variant [Aphanomyces astaci]